jgi:hypothetical protein
MFLSDRLILEGALRRSQLAENVMDVEFWGQWWFESL